MHLRKAILTLQILFKQYERFHSRGSHFETGQILKGMVFVGKFNKNCLT